MNSKLSSLVHSRPVNSFVALTFALVPVALYSFVKTRRFVALFALVMTRLLVEESSATVTVTVFAGVPSFVTPPAVPLSVIV